MRKSTLVLAVGAALAVQGAYAQKGGISARKLLQHLPLAGKKRLTETYLDDPLVLEAMKAAAE